MAQTSSEISDVQLSNLPLVGRSRALLLGIIAAVIVIAVIALSINLYVARANPWIVNVSVEGAATEISPDTEILVTTSGLGGKIVGATMHETTTIGEDQVTSERWFPVQIVQVDDVSLPENQAKLRLVQPDGMSPLRYDARYRLHVTSYISAPLFPLPTDHEVTRETVFKTLTTPQFLPSPTVIEPNYHDPLLLQWSAPISNFSVKVVPEIETRTRIDHDNPRVGYVELVQPIPGTRYEVTVTEALGVNGAPMTSSGTVTIQIAPAPQVIVDQVRLSDGNRIVVPWDSAIQSFDYEISPWVDSVADFDPGDQRIGQVHLNNYQQDQEYRVRITGAVGPTGAPMTDTPEFTIVTPPPVAITTFTPKDTAYGVSLSKPIDITFDQPIGDRAATESAIKITPAIPGKFEWPEPNKVRFIANDRLPPDTDISVRVEAGRENVQGRDGGYLPEPLEFEFSTQPNKLITVDLTQQTITLLEGGKTVLTAPVSTGVRGAETPTGMFLVDYKRPVMHFRGTNPSGATYDIPNVPWVLSFLGDYTIHGSPWRTQFGFAQSNGCVSMAESIARRVYEWAPVGTPVKIHY